MRKYCTLLFKTNSVKGPGEGIGCLLHAELRKRLQDAGICTILCWEDKESEGFCHKQMIDDLDGVVTSDGSVSTHIITGKVRRTRNLCIALCSGFYEKEVELFVKCSIWSRWVTGILHCKSLKLFLLELVLQNFRLL
ncbi:uncharacterized protein LOC122070646 [Macadamia integrifolia]|uniref:uncharacterized protein LOC122070646 n=1 Tax=Macadamia integrifolia TaxID=60698 RepID=UPI001C4FBF41|nr:uncharacterized protein LOC122070646 [Macadamia integrifolia]XP_042490767.1 uncharacterized protein LOC122070646 [Macadamia integrifolia]XP_042490768.1 uncharacterized protein LOC122070646 [Macadamia integrifolia]XP_042490769.1 uncharacterized protein LOC122070646 [Macadamia integrifolia]